MASTPEGKVKKLITALLKEYEDDLYYWMPVPSGYGTRQVDYIGCHLGLFFCIEAKRPGGKLTKLQEQFLQQIHTAGGATFVVDDEASLTQVREWLEKTTV